MTSLSVALCSPRFPSASSIATSSDGAVDGADNGSCDEDAMSRVPFRALSTNSCVLKMLRMNGRTSPGEGGGGETGSMKQAHASKMCETSAYLDMYHAFAIGLVTPRKINSRFRLEHPQWGLSALKALEYTNK